MDKLVNISMIMRIEEAAFSDLAKAVDHQIESLVDLESWPEIKSVSNATISEIKKSETVDGIEKRNVDNYTVGEVIDILSRFPRDYEFDCCGEQDYSIIVYHNSKTVSIDRKSFIDELIKTVKDNTHSNNKI